MVQPQPHGGSTLQWEMTGEEALGAGSQGSLTASSQGSLRVPPELAGNEVVHRLLTDNHQLRGMVIHNLGMFYDFHALFGHVCEVLTVPQRP